MNDRLLRRCSKSLPSDQNGVRAIGSRAAVVAINSIGAAD